MGLLYFPAACGLNQVSDPIAARRFPAIGRDGRDVSNVWKAARPFFQGLENSGSVFPILGNVATGLFQ
jgi:hypothetical protein